MDNVFELDVEINNRRGSYIAVAKTLQEAIDNARTLIFQTTGFYPIILGHENEQAN